MAKHPPRPSKPASSESDEAWKEALNLYFEAFIALLFPSLHAEIDWARGYTFLDKELARIAPKSATGRRVVDKLAQVYLKNGAATWLLIHIEVQGRPPRGFNERMYIYHYRIFDRYRVPVMSLAVVFDAGKSASFGHYEAGFLDCRVSFDFPVANLGDFAARWGELEASRNPFAIVIMAQLKALEAKGDNARKFTAKRELILGLYERGFSRQDIRDLFRVIDYLITLPEELETELRNEIHEYEEEKKMLISSWERMAKKEGLQQGVEQLVHRLLTHRFGELDSRTLAKIKKLSTEQLEDLGVALFDFAKVKDLKDWLARLNGVRHNGVKENGKKRASDSTRKQATKSRKH